MLLNLRILRRGGLKNNCIKFCSLRFLIGWAFFFCIPKESFGDDRSNLCFVLTFTFGHMKARLWSLCHLGEGIKIWGKSGCRMGCANSDVLSSGLNFGC